MPEFMRLKKLLCLVGSTLALGTSLSAGVFSYSFSLNGAGAYPPNESPGFAFGTLTVSDPDILTLDITYSSLGSDFTKVHGWFYVENGFEVHVDFYAGDLPPSGHWTHTEYFPTENILQSINAGYANLQASTINYPFSGFGEIGGYIDPVPVPEPAGVTIFLLGALGITVLHFRRYVLSSLSSSSLAVITT